MRLDIFNQKMILMEGSIVEQLRRSKEIILHDTLVNAPLIYDTVARETMSALYGQYIDLGLSAYLPVMICTPTWRTNQDRVALSKTSPKINEEAAAFLIELRESKAHPEQICIGGMIGCKNDCYLPDEGLATDEAEQFHSWQIERLLDGGVDYLIAETLPNVNEALGIAKQWIKQKHLT